MVGAVVKDDSDWGASGVSESGGGEEMVASVFSMDEATVVAVVALVVRVVDAVLPICNVASTTDVV